MNHASSFKMSLRHEWVSEDQTVYHMHTYLILSSNTVKYTQVL